MISKLEVLLNENCTVLLALVEVSSLNAFQL